MTISRRKLIQLFVAAEPAVCFSKTFGQRTKALHKNGRYGLAFLMGWPESGSVDVQSLAAGHPRYPKTVRKVELLDADGPLQFSHDHSGLSMQLPVNKPNDHAYALMITPV